MSMDSINEKIKETNYDISDLRLKKVLSMISVLGLGACAIAGTNLIAATFSELALPFALFSSFFPTAFLDHYFCKSNVKKALEKKVDHLSKIKKEGISKSEALDKKRTNQIIHLEEKQEYLKGPIDLASVIGTIGGLAWVLGAAATLFNPIAAWVSYAGMLGFCGGCIAEHNCMKKFYEYQTRIENLKDDLIYGPVYGHKTESKVKPSKLQENEQKGKRKSIDNSHYSDEIEQYVEQLDGKGDEKSSYQYKK